MNKLTILYITSNQEDEVFEQKIRNKLLEVAGENPIISISQKPITLGKNICVGEVGVSYRNANVQLLKGAETAITDYVAIAEADQLYPLGYFDFQPNPDIDLYMNKNLWILRCWDLHNFWKKEYGDWTVIVKRNYLIKRLRLKLDYNLEWGTARVGSTFRKRHWETFDVGAPVISIKTPKNLSKQTGIMRELGPVTELPYWGTASEISHSLGLNRNLGL